MPTLARHFLRLDRFPPRTQHLILATIVLSFIAAVMTVVVRMPMSWYDEGTHYMRSIQLSHGDVMVVENGNLSQVGGDVSVTQDEFRGTTWDAVINGDSVNTFWWVDYADLPYSSELVFKAATNTIPYVPAVYAPYVATAFFAHVFSIAPAIEFLLMRLAGLFTFFFIYLLAIRKSTHGKLVLSLLLLMPTLLESLASVTADGYLISFTALFAVCLLEAYQKIRSGTLRAGDIAALCIASAFLSLAKMPIFLFAGMLLPLIYFILRDKRLANGYAVALALTLAACAVMTVLWLLYVKDINTGAFWGKDVDTFQQLAYIRGNIPQFLLNLAFSTANVIYTTIQFGFGNVGTTNAPTVIAFMGYVGLYLAARASGVTKDADDFEDNTRLERGRRSIFMGFAVLAIVLFVILVFTMLYLQFTPIGANFIDGVQPRYFIPIWIFTLLLITDFAPERSMRLRWILLCTVLPLTTYAVWVLLHYTSLQTFPAG